MRLFTILRAVLIYGGVCAASEDVSEHLAPRDSTTTCSLGIGRDPGSVSTWDVTIYSVPQSQRQDQYIIAHVGNQFMDKGGSITVNGPPDITITNVNNAPAFTYDIPDLVAPLDNPDTNTKVQLNFTIAGTSTNWTTANCSAQSVVWSAGRESWECEFPCTVSAAKEL